MLYKVALSRTSHGDTAGVAKVASKPRAQHTSCNHPLHFRTLMTSGVRGSPGTGGEGEERGRREGRCVIEPPHQP
eukprot:9245004-Pyramimonas_sp.AAC.2